MICSTCKHENYKKHGHDRHGNQRYRCLLCGITWIPAQPKPLGDMRIDKTKAVLCLRMLLEGNSIRTTERLTSVNRNTIMSLLTLVGNRAQEYWTNRMTGLNAENVQVDEVWGFVGCKEKIRNRLGRKDECGDAYCFMAIERDTKLLISWHVGKRDPNDTMWFCEKLRHATTGRFQITTDGYKPYYHLVPEAFNGQVDFSQLVKIFGRERGASEAQYTPAQIIKIRKRVVWGHPDKNLISTSHIERCNLSIRMGVRRMTRLTNAFSKKWENHEAHLSLYFLYYNFCRVHATLKTTPAVAHGLTDRVWSIERLLDELANL